MTTDAPQHTQGPAPRPAAKRPAGRRRVLGWTVHAVLFVALAAGVFGLLPRLGGVAHDAAELRHARPGFIVAAVAAQAASLAAYALLYRSVQVSLGGRLGFPLAARVVLATFLVSHLTPFGSVTGTLLNVNSMESAGIPAATTAEAVALTTLVSTLALIALFGAGLIATAGHVASVYLLIAAGALVIAGAALAVALALGAHPAAAGRAGRWAAGLLRRLRPGTDPGQIAASWRRIATTARTALSGRALLHRESGKLDAAKWKQNTSNMTSITVETGHAHTGQYSVHMKFVAGMQNTVTIAESVTFPATPNKFYSRMWAYFAPDIPKATNMDFHTGFMMGGGNNDKGTTTLGMGMIGSDQQYLGYSIFFGDPKFEFGPWSNTRIKPNEWLCIELFEDGTDPTTEKRQIWLNDTELTDIASDSAKAAGNSNPNHLPPQFANVTFGVTEYHPIPTLSDMWIDDIRVSSQKIGCTK